MGEVRKIKLALNDELATNIDQAIQSGDYSDLNDVVDEALQAWATKRERNIARLRTLIDEGLASGEPKDVTDEWFESVKTRGLERLARSRTG